MGQDVSCNCLAQTLGMEDKEKMERLDMLKKGQKFMRSAFLGMTSREVFVTLTDDSSTIQWKAAKTNFLSEEKGEVDLTSIKTVKMNGASGMQFIGDKFTGDASKSQLDIAAEDPKIRDQWVIALNEVIQEWIDKPETRPKTALSAANTTNKDEYFAKRQESIKRREEETKELKKKYLTGGMKYTAIAMANRQT